MRGYGRQGGVLLLLPASGHGPISTVVVSSHPGSIISIVSQTPGSEGHSDVEQGTLAGVQLGSDVPVRDVTQCDLERKKTKGLPSLWPESPCRWLRTPRPDP